MKKNSIKIIFLILLLLPVFVKADLHAPDYALSKAFINKEDGSYIYTYDETKKTMKMENTIIPFNTDVILSNEIKFGNDLYYAEIYYGKECDKKYAGVQVGYDCKKYYVNLDNISVHEADTEYFSEKYEKDLRTLYASNKEVDVSLIRSNNLNVIVVGDNTPLYNGPSFKYTKKKNKLNMFEEFSVKVEVGPWYYVTNDNNTGWINVNDGVANKSFYDEYWFFESTPVYSKLDLSTIKSENLAKDTKSNNVYVYDGEEKWLIIKTDNGFECVKESNALYAVNYSENRVLTEDTKTYPEVGSKIFDTVRKNTKVQMLYRHLTDTATWYYINYDDDKYVWISYPITDNTGNNTIEDTVEFNVFIVENIDTYNKVNGSINGKIPANTVVDYVLISEEKIIDKDTKKLEERTYYYVEYDGKYYWIYGNSIMTNTSKSGTVISVADTDLYDEVGGNKLSVLPPNNIVSYTFSYKKQISEVQTVKYYYVEYNKRNYWIDDKTVTEGKGKAAVTVKLAGEQSLYNIPKGTKGRISVKANTKFVCEYIWNDGIHNWYFIDNNSYKGWINDINGSSIETEDPFNVLKKVDFTPQQKSSNSNLIVIIALVVVCGGAAAFVIIKKKKKKDVVVENPVVGEIKDGVPSMSENTEPSGELAPMSENSEPNGELAPMSESSEPKEELPPMSENVTVISNSPIVSDKGTIVDNAEVKSMDEVSELLFEDLNNNKTDGNN